MQSLEQLHLAYANIKGDLSSLRSARKLKSLALYMIQKLTSLEGPTEALEELEVTFCGLTGDLSALGSAHSLKRVDVSCNDGITSLRGVSTRALTTLVAEGNPNIVTDPTVDPAIERIAYETRMQRAAMNSLVYSVIIPFYF